MRHGGWERLGLAKVYLGLEGIEEGYVRHYDILLGRAIQWSGGLVATSRFLSPHLTQNSWSSKNTPLAQRIYDSIYNSLFGFAKSIRRPVTLRLER